MKPSIDEFAYLWEGGKDGDWVLEGSLPSVIPRNRRNRGLLLIEDDALAEEVIQRMVSAGVLIVKSIDDLNGEKTSQ